MCVCAEMETPFGTRANDLPLAELHEGTSARTMGHSSIHPSIHPSIVLVLVLCGVQTTTSVWRA